MRFLKHFSLLIFISLVTVSSFAVTSDLALSLRRRIISDYQNRISQNQLTSADHNLVTRLRKYKKSWRKGNLKKILKKLFDGNYEIYQRGSKIYYVGAKYVLIDEPLGGYFRISKKTCMPFCFLDTDLKPVDSALDYFEQETHFRYSRLESDINILKSSKPIDQGLDKPILVPEMDFQTFFEREVNPHKRIQAIELINWSDLDYEEKVFLVEYSHSVFNSFEIKALIDLASSSKDRLWLHSLNRWKYIWSKQSKRYLRKEERWKLFMLESVKKAIKTIKKNKMRCSKILARL